MNDFSNYIPVIVALIAGPAVVFITNYFSRSKVAADATATLTDISLSLVEPQKRRIADLEKHMKVCETRISLLEAENEALKTWAKHLTAQVIEAGDIPIAFNSSFLGGKARKDEAP